jgi:glycine/D-amino acid oxidase-like deaminating enzyme
VSGVPDMPVGADRFAFRRRLDGNFTISVRNSDMALITPDSFRLFNDFAPSLVKNWSQLRLRINRRFIEEWRTPRHWAPDAVSPFEKVRILDPVPSETFNHKALADITRAFPAFAQSRILQSWGGLIDVTPDAVPVISPVLLFPGLFLATGFSGHGFGIGPGAGKLMAELVMGTTPCVDPAPFRFERFRRTRNAKPAAASA